MITLDRLPLTLVVTTNNNASTLKRCLKSASWIPHILIVDAGSTDATLNIAREFGATVLTHPWEGRIAQRQFAVTQAKTDWVLCLDADEFLSKDLSRNIVALFQKSLTHSAYHFVRDDYFYWRSGLKNPRYKSWCIRLFNRKDAHINEAGFVQGSALFSSGWLAGTLLYHALITPFAHRD